MVATQEIPKIAKDYLAAGLLEQVLEKLQNIPPANNT